MVSVLASRERCVVCGSCVLPRTLYTQYMYLAYSNNRRAGRVTGRRVYGRFRFLLSFSFTPRYISYPLTSSQASPFWLYEFHWRALALQWKLSLVLSFLSRAARSTQT